MAEATVSPPAAPPRATKKATVTPDYSLSSRMKVDKNVVDELLLVCGVIGTTTDDKKDEIVPVTDCLNWLQDLQRALRRDDDLYRPISLLLGDWKIVQQKLLPLVLSCRYDTPMVLTICKILVILTKPLAENTKRAGRLTIDTKKTPENVVKEQIQLRENAMKQADTLMEYKRAICHHPSHIGPRKTEGGVLSIFVSLLAEPLSKTGTSRTDSDHLTIELVLHLFRNLLSAEPLLISSKEAAYNAKQLHHELISLLERELVLEILLVLGADVDQRENAQYNLLVMELLHHLLRGMDPAAVARAASPTAAAEATRGALTQLLTREKRAPPTRHSHFGGTLVVKRQGRPQYLAASRLGEKRTEQVIGKRKSKQSDPFIGRSKTAQENHNLGGPAQTRALQTLHAFCERFIKDCYGPVMKSLKNEFRRDSVRLEDGDRVVFFRIVWFLCRWWRLSGQGNKRASSDTSAIGHLIFTMDVFTFNLVLNATDTFVQHKKYARLAQTTALLSEMMHLLHSMYRSQEQTESIMAMGLMDRLFYGSDPIDRLPKLLSKWAPGTGTREYLADLVELCHMTLKLLETNAAACEGVIDKKNAKHDTILKMKAAAADFDVNSYVARKIVSNHTVSMYAQLLSQYAENSPITNHRIMAFFLRIGKIKVADGDEAASDPELPQNLLAPKTVTLEPMLFNIHFLIVLDKILNDQSIRKDKNFASLLAFASQKISNFAAATQSNPLLFVEALFKHPAPHRFCEASTNMYVSEELRMIAMRELLLEEQERFDSSRGDQADEPESDDEDEELEFEDFGVAAPAKMALLQDKSNKRKAIVDSDDDDDDDVASKKNDENEANRPAQDGDDIDSEDEGNDKALARIEKKAAQAAERMALVAKRARAMDRDSDDEEDAVDRPAEPKKGRFALDDSDEE